MGAQTVERSPHVHEPHAPIALFTGELLRELLERYVGDAAAEEEERLVIASLVSELQRGAPDAMQAVRSDWLPHAFLGRYEPRWEREGKARGEEKESGKLASAWEEAYDEAGGGTGAVLQHVAEILELLRRVVEGPSWALRRAAAHAVLELAANSGGTLLKRPAEAEAMAALVAQLRDRKWRDKEVKWHCSRCASLCTASVLPCLSRAGSVSRMAFLGRCSFESVWIQPDHMTPSALPLAHPASHS